MQHNSTNFSLFIRVGHSHIHLCYLVHFYGHGHENNNAAITNLCTKTTICFQKQNNIYLSFVHN